MCALAHSPESLRRNSLCIEQQWPLIVVPSISSLTATPRRHLSEFSGQKLEQLETVYATVRSDHRRLAILHDELLDRKYRREQSGRPEKTNAASLMSVAAGVQQSSKMQSSLFDRSPTGTQIGSRSERATDSRRQRQVQPVRPLGFIPTDEQLAALDAFESGEHLKINAFAGSGKTSTLSLLARNAKGCGTYAAFNRACVKDSAGRFPSNVKCYTVHAMAFRSMRGRFRTDKLTGKLNPNLVLSYFTVPKFQYGAPQLSEKQVASLALATFRRFAQSRHESIRAVSVPDYGLIGNVNRETSLELASAVHDVTEAIWSKMQDSQSPVPLGHDGYLKLWASQRPQLNVDFILLDEAQDIILRQGSATR